MRAERTLKPEIEAEERYGAGSREDRNTAPKPYGSKRHPLYSPYLGAVIAAGAAVLGFSVFHTIRGDAGLGWIIFALLTFITAAFSLKMPKSEVRISVPDVFIFSSILLFGPAIGALTAAMEGLMGSLRARTKSRRLQFAAFNMTAMSLSAYVAGKVHEWTYPQTAGAMTDVSRFQEVAFSLLVLAVWYFVLNTGLLALLISLEKRKSVIEVWVECFSWIGVGYLAAVLMAGMLSITAKATDPTSVALLVVVPAATYMTYRHVIRIMAENLKLKQRASSN